MGVFIVVAAAVLVVGVTATALGIPGGGKPGASPVAQASVPPTSAAATPATSGALPSTSPEPSPSPLPTPTPVPTPVTVPAPLTGEPVDPAVARRHPIAVMIDDLSAARPQSGLSSADVVWHAPAEGGIPRYMAIFQSTLPTNIGPIRSSRYYYITWAAEWRAAYVHAGGSPQAIDVLRAKGNGQYVYNVEAFRWGLPNFRRITTRFAPHNLYSKGPALQRLGDRVGAKEKAYEPVWRFAPDAPLADRPEGGIIRTSYLANKVVYRYDRASNTYLRSVSVEGKQEDAANGERIAPKNVVVMVMHFGPLNDGHPNKHRLEADVVGSGKAWISTNGRTILGTWKKTSVTGPTKFFDKNGKEVTLTMGQTFIQVMQSATAVSITKGVDVAPAAPAASPSPR